MGRIDRVLGAIIDAVLYLCASLLALMVSVMATQVVMRYMLSVSLPWAEEAVRFSLIWVSMLAGAVVTWRRGHVAVDVFVSRMPAAARRLCRLTVLVCGLLFSGVLFVKSIEYLDVVRITTAPALQITLDRVYLVLPVASALIFVAFVRHLLTDIGLARPFRARDAGCQ